MSILLNIVGIAVVIGICWAISWHRKEISWKLVIKALIAQLLIAIFIVKVPIGQDIIEGISNGITTVINAGSEGLKFVFGDLYDSSKMSVFVIQSLGNIIFVSALVGALYYLGIIGFIVKWIGKGVGKLMGTTEVETFISVANMFLGQTESPILVSKYLKNLTKSEIFVVLVSGMGSMSVSILGAYHSIGIPMKYLLIASVMVPIGSIMISKLIAPQHDEPMRLDNVKIDRKGNNSNVIDAIADGASVGMSMVIAIGASLVAFLGIVAVLNLIIGFTGFNLTDIFSYVFAPFGYLLGFTGDTALTEGALLGNKFILNEFIAFQDLTEKFASMDEKTAMISAISLCGFANVGSMGICIGGIGVLCPEKKGLLARLVFKAMIGGMFVSILSALFVSIASSF